MMVGPDIANLVKEFEAEINIFSNSELADIFTPHHEQTISQQQWFQRYEKKLVDTMQDNNPFNNDTEYLIKIASGEIASEAVVQPVVNLEQHGNKQYNDYWNDVILKGNLPIETTIKKIMFPLFRNHKSRRISKQASTIKALKNDCNLFGRLYIAAQHRNSDLKDFFKHENQPYPPSLSENGILRTVKKSELINCICSENGNEIPQFNCKIFDGAVLVHMINPTKGQTFNEYCQDNLISYSSQQSKDKDVRRVDVVWDIYLEQSTKNTTREKRGKGNKRMVNGSLKDPQKWEDFLKGSGNKEELFKFLATSLTSSNRFNGKIFVSTHGATVCSNQSTFSMQNCNHEEADTRIAVHLLHAARDNINKNILVKTVDTDVVVILVAAFRKVLFINNKVSIWVEFGMGKTVRHLHINSIYHKLGENKSRSLPMFHALTGCDSTSNYLGRGK
jgi:hypothetical protein